MFRVNRLAPRISSHFFKATHFAVRNKSCAIHFVNHVFNKDIIQDTFSPAKLRGVEMDRSELLFAVDEAKINRDEPSRLYHLIESIPENLSFEQKLDWLSQKLTKYSAMPVITMHPTFISSLAPTLALTKLTDKLMKLEKNNLSFNQELSFKKELSKLIIKWQKSKKYPSKKLTPDDEAKFALAIYKRIIKTFPGFRLDVVTHFMKIHGGDINHISSRLSNAIMLSFQNIFSWCMADFDGNTKRTALTLSKTLPSQQLAILEIYINKLNKIIKILDERHHASEIKTLQEMLGYFQRCEASIDADIWFDLAKSQEKKGVIKEDLDSLITSIQKRATSEETLIVKALVELHDLVDLAGFFGGLKEYVRQTTQLNQRVLSDLFSIIKPYDIELQTIMQDKTYAELSLERQEVLIKKLSQHSKYFKLMKQHYKAFTKETKREMGRLFFIKNNSSLFPSFISSDTENKNNFSEVSILAHFASYLKSNIHIGDSKVHTFNSLPLCETPKDLKQFIKIARAMFEDKDIRKKIVDSGFFSYVGGPSDLGKKGGIMVYVSLSRVESEIQKLLNEYKEIYPELEDVKLRVLHGFGGDMKRRNGSSANELHSTQQGQEAWRVLASTGAFPAFLHRVIGHPSGSKYRVQERLNLEVNHPEAFKTIEVIENQCINTYQCFIASQKNKDLLLALTSLSLEKELNISSRAGAKINWEDPISVRAIGFVNLFLLASLQYDVFMSVEGLLGLSESKTQYLPTLFNELTVIKDIVYKVLFTIAVSDFARAKVSIRNDVELNKSLDHIEKTALQILKQSTQYFSGEQKGRVQAYLTEAEDKKIPVNEMARGFMTAVGTEDLNNLAQDTDKLLPHFKVLAECVDAYKEDPTSENTINAVRACRAIPLAAGAKTIERLNSHLCPQVSIKTENVINQEVDDGFAVARPF